ncbi:ABC transporter substrate-binding protein [Halomarina pelagica]|uniref:ABC transporter substrate-binding protein n=1 Tax=Halomarina pelagica TaxID=2961599 RepID=UPI0020C34988|nr:ABC transporter substrate-binding protein [Halomarina sp. BND7]
MTRDSAAQNRRQLLKGLAGSGTVLLAGCLGQDGGGGGGGGNQSTTLKFVYPGYYSADAKDLLPMFDEQSKNLTVDGQKTPAESASTRKYYVNQFISQSSAFDVGMMDVVWPAEFAQNKWAAPVEDPENLTEKMLETPVEAVTIDGTLYGMPLFTDANALYYRSDLLKQHGYDEPPKTEMELVNMAQEITKNSEQDLNGYIWQGGANEGLTIMWLNWLWGREGTVDHDGTLVVNTQKGISALQHAVDLIHKYNVTPENVPASSTDQNRKTFQQGNTVFMRNWPYAYALMNKDGSPVKGKFAVASMPDADGHVGAPNSCLGGWNVFINSYSQKTDAANQFASFMASLDAQKNMALEHSRLPVRKELYAPKYKKKSQALDVFSGIVKETRARPATPKYSTFSKIVYTECNKALVQQKTPKQALDDAQKQIDSQVNDA